MITAIIWALIVGTCIYKQEFKKNKEFHGVTYERQD
jgi:hypothetical protein